MADFQIEVQVNERELQEAFYAEYNAGYEAGWQAGYDAGYLAADSYIQNDDEGSK